MFGRSPQKTTGSKTASSAAPDGTEIHVNDTAACQKSVRLRIGRELVDSLRENILLEFQRQAALPGFRKGKAPVDLVSRQYERQIREELLNRATHQALEQATKDQQLKPVSPFEVHTARIDEAGTITLEAVVEVEPVFKLSEYKGIAIAPPSSEITAQEREQALASLQESMAEQVPIGEGQTKEKKLPSIDDELAKDLGFKSLVELTEHVEAKLREKKRADSKHAVENAISDELLRRNVFEVPPRLVSRQIERLRRDFKMRLLLSGIAEDKLEEELSKFSEQLRSGAQRQVKLAFIFDRIAEQEAISVSQEELLARLWELSKRWKKEPSEVRSYLDAQGLWPSVFSAIRQEKTLSFLLSDPSTRTQP
ncbi:MAG: trigger factor [Candidatus Omnitrophica bacterium]|nr:trigger factor [Candidatus Omnitrophota bacterium]MBI3009703.1 trigger factor [Candidatus Omnitrophota bacterium]